MTNGNNGNNGNCCSPRTTGAGLVRAARPADVFESFFADFPAFPALGRETRTGLPAMDAWETEKAVVIEADVPGFTMDNIEISHLGDELTIKGSRAETAVENGEVVRRERRFGEFSRTIKFTTEVDLDRAEASLASGVLRVSVPKAEKAMPRKVAIKAS